MPVITIAKWKIDADPPATQEAYRKRQQEPYRCSCAYCRNFEAARDRIYTDDVLRLLKTLGVEPPFCEAEIYQNCRLDSGLHSYGGWLHVVGKLVEGSDARRMLSARAWTYDLEKINDHFSIGVTAELALVPKAFRDLPLIQLEFEAMVPWVLSEPCE